MREKSQEVNAPYGFTKFAESKQYVVYKNNFFLPFIRTGKAVYSEEQLQSVSVLDREHAMLSGVVFEEATGQKLAKRKRYYEAGHLTVIDDSGGIDIIPSSVQKTTKDFYVDFSIKNVHGDKFALTVNDYRTTRKAAHSIYKTNSNDLVIRVPARDLVSIRLPKGEHVLGNLSLL